MNQENYEWMQNFFLRNKHTWFDFNYLASAFLLKRNIKESHTRNMVVEMVQDGFLLVGKKDKLSYNPYWLVDN